MITPLMRNTPSTRSIMEMIGKYFFDFIKTDYFIGLIAFLLLLVVLKIWKREGLLSISGSKLGRMRISKHALKTVIAGVCSGFEAIVSVRTKLRIKRNKLSLCLKLKLGRYINLSELTEELQSKLYEVLGSDLGLENIGKIDIFIADFSGDGQQDKFLSEFSCARRTESGQQ